LHISSVRVILGPGVRQQAKKKVNLRSCGKTDGCVPTAPDTQIEEMSSKKLRKVLSTSFT